MTAIAIKTITRTTDKAICAEVYVSGNPGISTVKVWFPLSQVNYTDRVVECPAWLVERKEEEASYGRSCMIFRTVA